MLLQSVAWMLNYRLSVVPSLPILSTRHLQHANQCQLLVLLGIGLLIHLDRDLRYRLDQRQSSIFLRFLLGKFLWQRPDQRQLPMSCTRLVVLRHLPQHLLLSYPVPRLLIARNKHQHFLQHPLPRLRGLVVLKHEHSFQHGPHEYHSHSPRQLQQRRTRIGTPSDSV